ncbi:small subunit ribosomal protein S13 [Mycoplasmoides fastidiosum]|uniref:Small ribosomal subunit protein uS13 n=1 Tax=Mycoplasmoides fastidiosum TaxID=92758 RepID=A0ABU0LY24_9BACT|nr:30S ribosomal protein S13 [Mycoplasmoides fastidiosum]MDQ0513611.1 small subunit ribosomal protein S13 [Mycoplasmoides fastidiosum]UUD37966.1 30S ribosomal protein S13 [Mycoplasmoides fastidiosum]
MARLLGVDIPNNKRLVVSLTYILGVGPTAARKIIQKTITGHTKPVTTLSTAEKTAIAALENTRVKDLDKEVFAQVRKVIGDLQTTKDEFALLLEGDLRKEVSLNIKNKMEIGSYEGIRHRRGLPVRGQRTRTNARTRKGPRKTVANKKMESK